MFNAINAVSEVVVVSAEVITDTVHGIGSASRIFRNAMEAAEEESRLEAYVEKKKLLKDSGLTQDEITEFQAMAKS